MGTSKNVFLVLAAGNQIGAALEVCLTEEELRRVGLSCHFAIDRQCENLFSLPSPLLPSSSLPPSSSLLSPRTFWETWVLGPWVPPLEGCSGRPFEPEIQQKCS